MQELFVKLSKIMFRWVNFDDNYGRDIVKKMLGNSFKSVLDIGAGEGRDLLGARSVNRAAKLYAIENWQPNISFLRSKKICVYQGDVERMVLPFEDDSIDIVVINQVLEHTKDIFWILHEATRVLKPEGRIIIGVPNLAALHNRLMLLLGLTPECAALNSAHLRIFTFKDLDRFIKIFKGYSLSSKAGKGFYPFPTKIANVLCKIFPGLSWGLFVCYKKSDKYTDEFLAAASMLHGTNFYTGDYKIAKSCTDIIH